MTPRSGVSRHTPRDSCSFRLEPLSQPAAQSPLSMLFEGILADTPGEADSSPTTPSSISGGRYARLHSTTSSLCSISPCTPEGSPAGVDRTVSELRAGEEGKRGGRWEDSQLFASCFTTLPAPDPMPVDAGRGFSSVYTPTTVLRPSDWEKKQSIPLTPPDEKVSPPDEGVKPKRPPRPPRRCLAAHVEGKVGERGNVTLRSRRKSPREYLAPMLTVKPSPPPQPTTIPAGKAEGTVRNTHGSVSTATSLGRSHSGYLDLDRVEPNPRPHAKRPVDKAEGTVKRSNSEVSVSSYVSAVSQLDSDTVEMLDDARDNPMPSTYSRHHPPQPVADGYERRERKPSLLRKLSLTLRGSSKGRGGTDYSKLPTEEAMLGVTPYPLPEAFTTVYRICRSPTPTSTTATRAPVRSRSLSQPTTPIRGRNLSFSRHNTPPSASRTVASVVNVESRAYTITSSEGEAAGLTRRPSRRTILQLTWQIASVHSLTA